MIVHVEVNQDGNLQSPLPKRFHGKRVVLSVVSEEKQANSNWQAIKDALQKVDELPQKNRHIEDILADLRTLKESH